MIKKEKNIPVFIICGGVHSPGFTTNFVSNFATVIRNKITSKICIVPTLKIRPYDILNIYKFISQEYADARKTSPLIFIGFSAGVVGSIGAARLWQGQGGSIKCLFALDGWGVPLWANFPCYRLSHDYFTHFSSHFLGGAEDSFYAEPSVSHLDLWRSTDLVQGYWQKKYGREKITAINFIEQILLQTIITSI